MSAMHAGVRTTSTEMMYAQHVTLTADPPVHSISRSPLPAATGVRGREGFGSGKFLPGRGYLLWNDQHASAFHQSRAQNFPRPITNVHKKCYSGVLTKVSDQKLPQNINFFRNFLLP